jgi:DNA-binding MarR family transcriptional regulator
MTTPLRIDPIDEARRHWQARWKDDPSRAMAAVTSIMRAQQILLARFNGLLAPYGITFPRYEALMLLSFTRSGELPLGKIGERLQVHRTSVTNIVDKLEADGLVRRVPHTEDRRATLAQITPRGREIADAATVVLNGELFGIGGLNRDDQEQLTELLRVLRLDAGDYVP